MPAHSNQNITTPGKLDNLVSFLRILRAPENQDGDLKSGRCSQRDSASMMQLLVAANEDVDESTCIHLKDIWSQLWGISIGTSRGALWESHDATDRDDHTKGFA